MNPFDILITQVDFIMAKDWADQDEDKLSIQQDEDEKKEKWIDEQIARQIKSGNFLREYAAMLETLAANEGLRVGLIGRLRGKNPERIGSFMLECLEAECAELHEKRYEAYKDIGEL